MDASDIIGPRELAELLSISYGMLHKLTREEPRMKACAFTTGGKRPRYRYSLRLLREAGFLREVANA